MRFFTFIKNYINSYRDGVTFMEGVALTPVLVFLVLAYYLGGMAYVHHIDDDLDFAAAHPTAGGSNTVDMMAALIEREAIQNHWPANDPPFMPGFMLDNMPQYQMGILYALGRFSVQMSDQLGRARGSSQVDKDLDTAVGLLKYPSTVWVFNFDTSMLPTASSQAQYRRAREALLSYNARVVAGQAVFDRRADNLIATLDAIAADLGSQSAIIDEHISNANPILLDMRADDIFYATKGRVYTYYLLLRELQRDYAQVFKERDIDTVWNNMLGSFKEAAAMQPAVVVSGAPDSQFLPSHLAGQGFYLLRARTQLREISNILTK